ncbi:hypothetical protein TcasGA2_TC001125 [Tribolium castaneum]|uniref:Uncharacterized protein n=1 Tax=Tribolium castaneum TaxID=7070 RepID=D6WAA1_TRICA|nr:hypothetical protein TcasGA2_TC001125 [Tribolium castaneum]
MVECDEGKPSAKKPKAKPAPVSKNAPLLEFPHFLRMIGPKHIRVLMAFVPSAICYTFTSLILVTYMSEWKTVLQYFPYYNGKYQTEETSQSANEGEEEAT